MLPKYHAVALHARRARGVWRACTLRYRYTYNNHVSSFKKLLIMAADDCTQVASVYYSVLSRAHRQQLHTRVILL